jgi:hypothetical protein
MCRLVAPLMHCPNALYLSLLCLLYSVVHRAHSVVAWDGLHGVGGALGGQYRLVGSWGVVQIGGFMTMIMKINHFLVGTDLVAYKPFNATPDDSISGLCVFLYININFQRASNGV